MINVDLIYIIELLGVVAFALSGVFVGIEYDLDIFGIFFVALTTAVGGGLFRDLVLGNTPALMFTNVGYVLCSIITTAIALIIFKIYDTKFDETDIHRIKALITIFDAIGLGLYTVSGIKIAFSCGYSSNVYLCVFVGVMTGVGGGIMRDMLAGRKPVVMRKEIYAIISLIGGIIYYYLALYVSEKIGLFICAPLIAIVRLIAVRGRLNLPFKIKNQNFHNDDD